MDPELLALLRLVLTPEIGPATAHRLIRRCGSAEAIFQYPVDDFAIGDRLPPRTIQALGSAASEDRAEQEYQQARSLEVRLIPLGSADYPANLAQIPNPPLVLYVLGGISQDDNLAIGVVGPRKPSDYAREMTRALVPPLCARAMTIVSGLAYGIDAEAHTAALECGGRTLAVLAQGLESPISPASNRALARRIIEGGQGAAVSIFPFGTNPEPGRFPQRNLIIAALSLGTLIIEAGEESGALLTATNTADLGRTVMACPGDATRPNARGSNQLLAEGAFLIQKSDDVLAALSNEIQRVRHGNTEQIQPQLGGVDDAEEPPVGPKARAKATKPAYVPADPLSAAMRELLINEHRPIDYILERCAEGGFTQSEVVQKLLILELNGVLRQLPGRVYSWISG